MAQQLNIQKARAFLKSLSNRLGKWKLPLLLLALGLLLLLYPTEKKRVADPKDADQPVSDFDLDAMQQRLEATLSEIDGAGRVRVMLTLDSGEEAVYQQDQRLSSSDTGTTTEKETVLQSDSGSEKSPVVVLRRCPRFRGALIVCDGAERASVRLSIIEAVSGLTGLGSDKISVIKMKGQ